MKRTITLLATAPFVLGACGLATHGPPKGHENMMTPFSCTESLTGPAGDIAAGLATLFLVSQLTSMDDSYRQQASENARVLVGPTIVVAFAVSAIVGFDRVTRCREARQDLRIRQEEAAAAVAARTHSADLIGVQKVLITGRDTITVGSWTQLVAQAYDSTGAVILDRSFAWSSSNDTIVSVSAAGLVRAGRVGTAVITANADNVMGMVNVVVVSDP